MSFKQPLLLIVHMAGLVIVSGAVPPAAAQGLNSPCGELYTVGQYGPFDYRYDRDKLPIVINNHFTAEVEALIRGITTKTPGADIDYTLRTIPNNHRALIAMMRLGEKEKTNQPRGSRYTVDCWFDRAVRFRPEDAIVRMIYSSYLNQVGRITDANAQLGLATNYAQDSGFTHYNIGLHYFDLKNFDQALIQAHKAMEFGFTRTELRDKLLAAGKWQEPVPAPISPAPQEHSAPELTQKPQ